MQRPGQAPTGQCTCSVEGVCTKRRHVRTRVHEAQQVSASCCVSRVRCAHMEICLLRPMCTHMLKFWRGHLPRCTYIHTRTFTHIQYEQHQVCSHLRCTREHVQSSTCTLLCMLHACAWILACALAQTHPHIHAELQRT